MPFDHNFNIDSGVNTDMIKYLCDKKKISLYAFDSKDNCFEKCVYATVSNYKPIVYYAIDGHMYIINDSKVIKQLSSAQKANKNMVVSSMLEMDKKTVETVEREYIECTTFNEALLHENKVIYIPQSNMTEEVHLFIAKNKSVPKLKVSNHNIIEMQLSDKNLTIICDSNISDGYTWKDIKAICDKVKIPFKNQKIGTIIADLRKNFFKPERRVLNEEEKESINKTQNKKCIECGKKCEKLEYDHITPLALGGSNDLTNFQGLCQGCHLDKTMKERENSDFIKFDDTASTFNSDALNIIRSQSYKQWAFVEKLKTEECPAGEHNKIDHVKCRRNLVMHSRHDYPMYSVMDYPKPYDGSPIVCGEYFVNTDNYYPFRGSGFYNHVMVKRALELQIITKDNITHMFIPSFTIKNDHFKKFCEFLIDITQELGGISKLIVNSLVGTWGTQKSTFESINMTLDKYEASRELIRDGVQVIGDKISFYNDDKNLENITIYSIIDRLEVNKDDMYLPIYNQIVAMEGMELYELEQMIIRNGGIPLERNTDAILYAGEKIDIDSYFWDIEKTVNKYIDMMN